MSIVSHQIQIRSIPLEIAEIVIHFVSASIVEDLAKDESLAKNSSWYQKLITTPGWQRKLLKDSTWYRLLIQNSYWCKTLSNLKGISRVFRAVINDMLYRNIQVLNIDQKALKLITLLTETPAICSVVRSYDFIPGVSLERPSVTSFGRPRHDILAKRTRRYDEQEMLMYPPSVDTKPVRTWIQGFVFRKTSAPSTVAPVTSQLKTLPWFTSIHKFTNLQELSIGYRRAPQVAPDIHYVIKNDMSAGLARILTSLVQLRSLSISAPTLSDLYNLVYFIYETSKTPSVVKITSLEILMVDETLKQYGRVVYTSSMYSKFLRGFHAHVTGGKPISDLLDLFPELETLTLYYNQHHEMDFVIAQDLWKSVLPRLRRLEMHGFALSPSILLSLMPSIKFAPEPGFEFDFYNIALFNNGIPWSNFISTWTELENSYNALPAPKFSSWHEEPCLCYLDMSVCTDEVLRDLTKLDTEILIHMSLDEDMAYKTLLSRSWRIGHEQMDEDGRDDMHFE